MIRVLLLAALLIPVAAEDLVLVDDSLNATDPQVSARWHTKEYRFPAVAGTEVEILCQSLDFVPYLMLTTPDGRHRDLSSSSTMLQVAVTITADGVHRLLVSSADDEQRTGDFRLRVSNFGPPLLAISGSRSRLDPVDPLAGPPGAVTAMIEAGLDYQVDLSSPDFDTLLRVSLPDGRVLEDDDGGGNTNSRLRFTASQTGAVMLHPASYDDRFGRYDLSLRRSGPSALPDRLIGNLVRRDQRLEVPAGAEAEAAAKVYAFTTTAEAVRLICLAEQWDCEIEVVAPDGSRESNDDWNEVWISRLDLSGQPGRWLVRVGTLVSEHGTFTIGGKGLGTLEPVPLSEWPAEAPEEAVEAPGEDLLF